MHSKLRYFNFSVRWGGGGGGLVGWFKGWGSPLPPPPRDEALKCGCVCDCRNEKISIKTTIVCVFVCVYVCSVCLRRCPWMVE